MMLDKSFISTSFDMAALRRGAVILCVLLSSAALALLPAGRYGWVLAAVAGLGMAGVLLRWPEAGLVALIPVTLVVPLALGTGTQTPINATVVFLPLLLGFWLVDMLHRRAVRLVPSPVNPPLLAFGASVTLSLVAGNLPWNYFAANASFAAQLGGWAIFVLSIGVFLLAANRIRDVRWLKALVGVFLALGALYVAGRLVPVLAPLSARLLQTGAAGSLFWIWLVALAAGQAIANPSLRLWQRLSLLALVLASLAVGWLNRDWASGWVPPLIAVAAVVALRFPLPGLALDAAGAILFVSRFDTLLRVVSTDTSGSLLPWEARLAASRIVLEVVKLSPILGLGPANYYHHVQLYPLMGYYVRFNSHNNYTDLVAQAGLLGLGLFLAFALVLGLEGWRLRKVVTGGFAVGYVYGCLGGLLATLASGMLADWFLPFVYNVGLTGFRASVLGWLFLGGLVALREIHRSA